MLLEISIGKSQGRTYYVQSDECSAAYHSQECKSSTCICSFLEEPYIMATRWTTYVQHNSHMRHGRPGQGGWAPPGEAQQAEDHASSPCTMSPQTHTYSAA